MSNQSTLVADRYRLVEMLRTDAMGIVWQASDERLHRAVALKVLRVDAHIGGSETEVATDRTMRAGRRAAELQHAHAVTVLDVVEHEGQPCIVTEFVESTPLSLVLRDRGTLPPSEAAPIGAQVASALEAAHKKRIVHGAVNPGSVLMAPDGSAMIGDFGLWRALGNAAHNSAYVAPEVARGREPRSASDVFSLGAMLYEMVEGTTPFGPDDADHPHTISRRYREPEQAGSLEPLLRRMLAVNPQRRPSMASVVDSLSAPQDDADADAFERLGLITGTPPIDDGTANLGDFPQRTVRTGPVVAAAAATDAVTEEREPNAAMPAAVLASDAATEVLEPDQRARPDLATAETRPLPDAAAAPVTTATASAPPPRWKAAPPSGSSQRRRPGAGVIAGILILLVALPVSAALLLDPLPSDIGRAVSPTQGPVLTATPSQDADPSPSTAAPPDPAATAAPPPPAPGPAPRTPSNLAAPAPAPEVPAPSEPAPPAAEEQPAPPAQSGHGVVDMISGYYALVPGNRDAAWPLMTADYQQYHAGGRSGYDAFWSTIESVEIAGVTATAPDRAQATLTYHFYDGRVVQELTSFRLVDEGGVLKIAETAVLSSTAL